LAELERIGFLVAGSASVTRKGMVFAIKAPKQRSLSSKTTILEGESISAQATEPFIEKAPILAGIAAKAEAKEEHIEAEQTTADFEAYSSLTALGLKLGPASEMLEKYGAARCLLQLNNIHEQLEKGRQIKNKAGWMRTALEKSFSAAGSWQSPHVSPAESEALALMSAAGIDADSQENFLDLFGLEKCIKKMHALNQAIEKGTKISNKKNWFNKALQKKEIDSQLFDAEMQLCFRFPKKL
jgi:hypothetical protein